MMFFLTPKRGPKPRKKAHFPRTHFRWSPKPPQGPIATEKEGQKGPLRVVEGAPRTRTGRPPCTSGNHASSHVCSILVTLKRYAMFPYAALRELPSHQWSATPKCASGWKTTRQRVTCKSFGRPCVTSQVCFHRGPIRKMKSVSKQERRGRLRPTPRRQSGFCTRCAPILKIQMGGGRLDLCGYELLRAGERSRNHCTGQELLISAFSFNSVN